MSQPTWNTRAAVVVCGVHDNEITSDGGGVQRFASLEEALKTFPDLDPAQPTSRFTGAMASYHKTEMRFETHEACRFYAARFPRPTGHKWPART